MINERPIVHVHTSLYTLHQRKCFVFVIICSLPQWLSGRGPTCTIYFVTRKTIILTCRHKHSILLAVNKCHKINRLLSPVCIRLWTNGEWRVFWLTLYIFEIFLKLHMSAIGAHTDDTVWFLSCHDNPMRTKNPWHVQERFYRFTPSRAPGSFLFQYNGCNQYTEILFQPFAT